MQARPSKTFVENHLAMLALAIGVLAIAVTLVIANAISSGTGSSNVPAVQPVTARPAIQVSSNIGFDPGMRSVAPHDISARTSWGLGVGLDPGFIFHHPAQQVYGFQTGLTEH